MSKRLGGIIDCKYKTSSWHLNGFPVGSNMGSTVLCRGEAHRYTVHFFTLIAMQGHQTKTKQKQLNRLTRVFHISAIDPYTIKAYS